MKLIKMWFLMVEEGMKKSSFLSKKEGI